MEFYNLIQMIEEHVLLPIIIAFGAALLIIFKHFFDKISKSIVAKNEIAEMEKQASIRNELLATIQENVKTAVASNMQTAREMKKGGRKLDEYQIQELNNSAMNIVIGSLPPSLTEDGGILLDFIGSREKLNGLISAMIEKYVYEYQINEVKNKSFDESTLPAIEENNIETEDQSYNEKEEISSDENTEDNISVHNDECPETEGECTDTECVKQRKKVRRTQVLY